MGTFLFITPIVLPFLLAGFGLISLLRRRFELKHLALNAIITLIAYWFFVIVLVLLYFKVCMGFGC